MGKAKGVARSGAPASKAAKGIASGRIAKKSGPKHSMDPGGRPKGGQGQRSEATVKRLAMYKQRPVRDAKGKVLFEQFQSRVTPETRIVPDRRWFGNTRVVGQQALEAFRGEMAAKSGDAYTVVLKGKSLPLALLEDPEKVKKGGKAPRAHVLTAQPFAETFGVKAQRKRPAVAAETLEELLGAGESAYEDAQEGGLSSRTVAYPWARAPGAAPVDASHAAGNTTGDGSRPQVREALFAKGQSKRIWGELYKVVDSSDVLVQVLDARDPIGTRCAHLEAHLKQRTQRHRHMVLLLNKCDLVPAWVTKRWLHTLSRDYPTIAFHASMTHPFGKGALLSLLRQFGRLHGDKPNISVGFFGYPNVGKSSVINTLRAQKVCTVAPVPGETKVWQYVNLTKKIFLIDCPGVVYNGAGDTDTDAVLKGVVRVSNLDDASEHVAEVLRRVKPEYLRRAYRVSTWTDSTDFLTQLARASGKLLKGGEPDLSTAAKSLLLDWQRGRIPFFVAPPQLPERAPGQPPAPSQLAADARLSSRDAEAVALRAAEALRRQVSRAMPSARGMFTAEDEAAPEGEAAGDALGDHSAQEESPMSDDEDEDDDEDAAQADDAEGADGQPQAGRPEEDDGSESDGYGDEGLTWDAVLADLKGEGAAAPADAAALRQPGKKAGKRKAKREAEAASKVQAVEASGKKKRRKLGGGKFTSE